MSLGTRITGTVDERGTLARLRTHGRTVRVDLYYSDETAPVDMMAALTNLGFAMTREAVPRLRHDIGSMTFRKVTPETQQALDAARATIKRWAEVTGPVAFDWS